LVNGLLLTGLGIWALFVGQVGPYVDFGFAPDRAWAWSNSQLLYEVLPGAVAFAGGVLLVLAADRVTGLVGGWLASAAGAWLVVGPVLDPIWDSNRTLLGAPIGSGGGTAVGVRAGLEHLLVFQGVGALILFLAATAAARFSVPTTVTYREPIHSGAR
jgi:hypothetical protein